jgi:hypothetical protein
MIFTTSAVASNDVGRAITIIQFRSKKYEGFFMGTNEINSKKEQLHKEHFKNWCKENNLNFDEI